MTGSLIAECVLRLAAALALLGFSGCAGDAPPPSGQPSFYRNLAQGGQLDPARRAVDDLRLPRATTGSAR